VIPSMAFLALAPADAFAGGRGYRGGDCGSGGYYRGGSRTSIGISLGDCGSSFAFGYSSGYRGGYRGGYWNNSCGPRYVAPVYCPPPVAYCPPPVTYCAPAPVIVRSAPVYVERPVYVDRPVVVERPVVVQTVSAPVPPAPVPVVVASAQDRDLGTTYLRLGDLDNAARLYQRYLATYSNDAYAQRGLGLVELGRGNALEGSRWLASAYRTDRTLTLSPPSPEGVGGTAVYQRMLDTAVGYADQARTPESWLSVAVLQHGLGQREAALQSMQRAREAGLEVAMLDAMTLATAR